MKIVTLKGKIELLSGLHIGGGDDTMKIGGIDKEVVKIYDKNLKRDVPYIPGSSIKGKMRSLLEWNLRLVEVSDGNPFSSDFLDNVIFNDEKTKQKAINLLKLFGDASNNKKEKIGITRAVFCDSYLSDETKEMLENGEIEIKEAKYENSIDRRTGTASNPRQIERVPAGVEFDFEINIKVLPEDNEEELKNILKEGIKLLELDYLGGAGSRGYGRVQINYEWK